MIVGPNVGQIQSDQASSTPHGKAVVSGTASVAKVGGPPGGEDSEGDEEPTISIMKRGHGGTGDGSGNGSGDGIDRGLSGANNETPGIILNPQPELPLKEMVTPANGKSIFEVMVLPDGNAGEIKLLHSCGDATIDAACKTALARWKFRPAYRNGKTFAATTQIAFTFGGAG